MWQYQKLTQTFRSHQYTRMAEEVKKIDGMFMENLQEWVLEEDKVI